MRHFAPGMAAVACASFTDKTAHITEICQEYPAEYFAVTSYPRRCGVADLVAHTDLAQCACSVCRYLYVCVRNICVMESYFAAEQTSGR